MHEKITFDSNTGKKELIKVGPGFWGYIYKSKSEPFCYRLIPINEVHSLSTRNKIRELVNKPGQRGISAIKDVFQSEINNNTYLVIQYEIDASIFWKDILNDLDPIYILKCFSEILKMLPQWWLNLGTGLLPLPSEIVFYDNVPFLLQMPFIDFPSIGYLINDRERWEYIAPEFFSLTKDGWTAQGKNLDIFTLGISINKALHISKETKGDFTVKTNTNSFKKFRSSKKKVPAWSEKIVQIISVYTSINQLISNNLKIRSFHEPERLAKFILENLRFFDPFETLKQLLQENKTELVYSLIKDMLISDNSYKMQMLAASIAHELKLIFEAVEHYEEAIKANQSKAIEPYLSQLDLLLKENKTIIVESVLKHKTVLLKKIEEMIVRDFKNIPFINQQEYVDDVVLYVLSAKNYSDAAILLHPHLFDENKKYLWWKFERNIQYANCLIGQKRMDDAKKIIATIRKNLQKVEMEKGRMRPELIICHKKELLELEKQILSNSN